MKKQILTIAILISGLSVGSLLVTSCGGKQAQQEQAEHEHEHEDDTTHQHESDTTQMAYACPMHPEVTGKEGDICSKCNMKLEPVKEEEKED